MNDTPPERRQFFGWQCRVRQIAMRQHQGQPQSGMIAVPNLDGRIDAGIVTVMVRREAESELPEIQHIIRRSHDPEQRLKDALKLFSERYYQDPDVFEDTLCAVFQPNSAYAERLVNTANLSLEFRAYQQHFSLQATASRLDRNERLFAETYWHNLLFNPNLSQNCVIIGLKPGFD